MTLSEEVDLRMTPGSEARVDVYDVKFFGTTAVQGPNYVADQGRVEIRQENTLITTLFPEKRRYLASNSVMTEAAIEARFLGDLYVALGEPLPGDDAWAVRVHIKPFVRWIWFGGLMIAISGMMSVLDQRYRSRKKRSASVKADTGVLEAAHG